MRLYFYSFLVTIFFVAFLASEVAFAQRVQLVLKDGRTLEGRELPMSRIDEKPEAINEPLVRNIILVDDGLRQTFIPRRNIAQASVAPAEQFERFKISQRTADSYRNIDALSSYTPLAPFDEYGRRTVRVPVNGVAEMVVQSITEINPRYVRLQGLQYGWDARVATNTFPRGVLAPIIRKQIEPTQLDDRKRLVRFYLQAELLDDAAAELENMSRDFPAAKEELAPLLRRIQSMASQRILDELEARAAAGQYQKVRALLDSFAYEHATPESLQRARRILEQSDNLLRDMALIKSRLRELSVSVEDEARKQELVPILDEIESQLSFYNVARFTTFLLHWESPHLSREERLAAGIAAWFTGDNSEVRQLATAISLRNVRDLAQEYLIENEQPRRRAILEKLKVEEAATPPLVAGVLATMRPPFSSGATEKIQEENLHGETLPGFYEMTVPGSNTEPTFALCNYSIQLPPEYNPDKSYPLIVSLNGTSTSPQAQLDFWCGPWHHGARVGQATRHGYIVLAPHWNPAQRFTYDFSARGHYIVLASLRDALGKFNIDTDRVFITGHDNGGDAAWDIGMAHPDLWGGVIPIGAIAGKYINEYVENARFVPFYYVGGELESFRGTRKSILNAPCLNRYLKPYLKPHEATVVFYKGRGAERFGDEQVRLFDWMKRHPRNFAPDEFQAHTLRSWDTFFWCVELGDIGQTHAERLQNPMDWISGNKASVKPLRVTVDVQRQHNRVRIDLQPRVEQAEIFLTPAMIRFDEKAEVLLNGRSLLPPRTEFLEPSIEVMLEDARSRRDRIHPFWIRLVRTK